MTHDEIRAAIEKVGGGAGRGMIKAAARVLDVSEKTISRAYNDGHGSVKFIARMTDAAAALTNRQEKALSSQAGSWSIGHVENRQGGKDVVDESVVLHLANPSFVFHVEMLRGKGDDGGARWSESVRWYDKPRNDDQRQMLLKIAREKGQASIYDRSQASADIRMREHHMSRAERHGAAERDELIRLGPLALSAEAECVDVTNRLAEMSNEIQGRNDELGTDLCRASVDLGQWFMAHKMAAIVMQDTPQSTLPAYVTAKAYRLLPQAHKNTLRGQRVNVGVGVHDEIEIVATSKSRAPSGLHVTADYDETVDHFADIPDEAPDPVIEGRKRAAAAVRAHLEGRYAYNALSDSERALFDMKLRDELGTSSFRM